MSTPFPRRGPHPRAAGPKAAARLRWLASRFGALLFKRREETAEMSAYQRLASASLAAAAVALVVAACGSTPTHTPQATSSSRTPQATSGSRTPQATSGSRTPQATSSSRTPQATSSSRTPQATSGSRTPQATSGSRTPQATSSSRTPQANSAYPYAPGGVTYKGEGGAVETFSIPAATYSLNQQASYDPANDPDGTGECLFGGELDYLSGSGGTIPLGDGGVPITAQVPIEGPPSDSSLPGRGLPALYLLHHHLLLDGRALAG